MADSKRREILMIGLLVLAVGVAGYFAMRDAPAQVVEESQVGKKQSLGIAFEPEPYAYRNGLRTRDGIGKYYYDREISQVMGHPAIGWLERPERVREEDPVSLIDALELPVDAVVADIGAGSGYHCFMMAELLPDGLVIGVDIQQEMLDFLGRKAQQLGVKNVRGHLGRIDSVDLPAESIDAVLLVDAYHEFSHPNEMMQSVVHALRPGGRVFQVEYRGEDREIPIKPLHKMTEAQCILEMEAVGLRHKKTLHHLPMQHLLIFEKAL